MAERSSKHGAEKVAGGAPAGAGDELAGRDAAAAPGDPEPPGFWVEFWQFLRLNKRWWLIPIVLLVALLVALVVLSKTPLAPFIYQ